MGVGAPWSLLVGVIAHKTGRVVDLEKRMYYLGDTRAMVSKAPGFVFSSYPQLAKWSPILVSMDTYYEMMKTTHAFSFMQNRSITLPDRPPKRAMYISIKEDATFDQREGLANGIRNFLQTDRIVVTDTFTIIETTDTAIFVLDVFFNVISLIVLVLGFFTLLISFTSNINENAWEFGVLRAIGLNVSPRPPTAHSF